MVTVDTAKPKWVEFKIILKKSAKFVFKHACFIV